MRPTAVVPALHVAPGQHRRLGATQSGVGQDGDESQVETGALSGLLGRFNTAPAKAGLDGGEADHGQHIGGEGAGLALGLREAPSPSFQGGAHARVPAGGLQLRPLVGLGDGGGGQTHGGMLAPSPARAAR